MDAPVLVELISNPINLNVRVFHPPDTANNDENLNSYVIEHNNDENTGFPFDDSDFDERDRSRSFRSHLDDIAKRHPEFAEHFTFDNKFPFRSNTWGHKRRGSEDESKASRFAEFADRFNRPSSSRFKEKFGFPFSDTFDAGPTEQHQTESEPSKDKQHEEENIKPPQVPTKERGRKQNPNLPQSSTVDLGQKQDPVCDTRGQRSMSAPPENRAGQRFVSSINIPINTDGGGEPSPTPQGQQQRLPQQQQQQQTKSNERVIPIHVEGRDEPVIPKHTNHTFSQPPPQTEKVFGQNKPGFGAWKRDEPPYYTGEPKFFQSEPGYFSPDPHFDGRSQFFSQERPNAEHFSNTGAFKHQANQKPQQPTPPPVYQKSATPPPQPQQQQQEQQQVPPQQQEVPPQQSSMSGPIAQIQCIQKSVLDLMNQVEKFNGRPRDKQYIYLDEMLTRNLLKLDDIDTQGKENIRHARKEAIVCIQKCINILEAKAMANEQLRSEAMDVDTVVESSTPLVALQVSGISRSGSENSNSNKEAEKEESEAVACMEAVPSDSVAVRPENNETESESTPVGNEEYVEKGVEASVAGDQESSSQVESEVKKEETNDKKKVKKKESN